MINMPYPDIIEKIKEEKSISDDELDERIKQKMDQLSGLISKEGAAYIVANDLGVKLIQTGGPVQIKGVVAGMRSVETAGKVTKKFDVVEFDKDGRKGRVGSFIIADETGQIRVTAWHDQTALLGSFNEGDTVKLLNGYVRNNQGQKEIHLNDRSRIIVNPPGIDIKGVAEPSRPESSRKKISDLNENDQNVEIFGTVVQVFDPRFFEQCPECRKKVIQKDSGFVCERHGAVTPDYGYVVNVTLDDGSDSVRAVMFRQQMQQLFRKNDEELMSVRESPEKIDLLKTELLGEQIIVAGRTTKNAMFDRLEIIANRVERDVDPEKEIKRLKEKAAPAQDASISREEQPMPAGSSVVAEKKVTERPAPKSPESTETSAGENPPEERLPSVDEL